MTSPALLKGSREYAGGALKSLECSVLPLIKTLPSRLSPRDTRPHEPGQGKILMPGSPPFCLPGTEIKVIMGIQEWKHSALLVMVLQETQTQAAVALGSRQHHCPGHSRRQYNCRWEGVCPCIFPNLR